MIRRNVYNDGNVERRDSCGKKQYRYLLSDVASEIGKMAGRPTCQKI